MNNATMDELENYCYYSDLPSPMAYLSKEKEETITRTVLDIVAIDRIIEMAWEDRTPFDAIEKQFGLKEAEVKALMKRELKFSAYKTCQKKILRYFTLQVYTATVDYREQNQQAVSFYSFKKPYAYTFG